MARQACEPGMMEVRAGGGRERYFQDQHTKCCTRLEGFGVLQRGCSDCWDDAICHLTQFCMCVPCLQRLGGRM